MAVASLVSGTRQRPRRRVDAELQALCVHVVRERLHVGEFPIGQNPARCIASSLPGVVDVHVKIAGALHPRGDHRVGDRAHRRIVDGASEMIPTVPPHRRRSCKTVVGYLVERRRVDACGQTACGVGSADGRHLLFAPVRADDRDAQLVARRRDAAVLGAPRVRRRSGNGGKPERRALDRAVHDRLLGVRRDYAASQRVSVGIEDEHGFAERPVAVGEAPHPAACEIRRRRHTS